MRHATRHKYSTLAILHVRSGGLEAIEVGGVAELVTKERAVLVATTELRNERAYTHTHTTQPSATRTHTPHDNTTHDT